MLKTKNIKIEEDELMKVLFWMFIGFDQQATSEHLLTAVIEQLCLQGHSVHIVQKNTGGNLPHIPELLLGYPITTKVIPFQSVDKGNFIARYLAELKYIRNCKRHFTSDYDAVFIQSTPVAGFAVRAIRKKLPRAIVTFNVQDIFPYNAVYTGTVKKNSLMFKILARIQRYGYKHSNHIITISEDMKETLVEDGIPDEKIKVIYNWSYQDEPYKNVDLSQVSYMFSAKYYNIVYAGNIGVMQNVDILIKAAKLMKNEKDIWFHIIGNGVYKDKLKQRAKEFGITNISFWPMMPPELAPAIYSAADVNVIPLVKNVYKTALPSKTATCLACGKPIIFAIGKESQFADSLQKKKACCVVESNNPDELCATIRTMLLSKSSYNDNAVSFFMEYCRKSNNSASYAQIIVTSSEEKR